MSAPITEHVRNIALVGQDGAGKTSFAEAMLHISGKTPRMGTTHNGKSYLDYDDEEIKRRFTLGTSIAPIPYKDNYKINLLDTSGQVDFLGDTLATMNACEMCMFVIDAVEGPQAITSRLWAAAEKMRTSRSIFVNHIDKDGANFDVAMAQLHARFGSRLGAVSIPIGVGSKFKGVIDVLRMQARYFENGSERVTAIPDEYKDAAQIARDKLCDLVAEADDELMMKYLEGEESLTQDELESLLAEAIAQEIFIPVFVGSTIIEQGIKGIMDDICSYFPHPRHHGPFVLADGEELIIDESGEPAGFVFKTVSDPYVGRLSFIKTISGYLNPATELINTRTNKKERLGHLYVMTGKEPMDVKSAKAGDIIVVPKLNDTKTGDTLSLSGKIKINPFPLPTPQYPVVIKAKEKKDEDKLGTFISRQAEVDPTIKIVHDTETRQQVIYTMGDMQVDVLLSKLKAQTGIDIELVSVRIPYRETITETSKAQGRHKKQTGGSGQFGDCWLRLSPNPKNGFLFASEVVGGRIPKNFIPAIEKGVEEAMQEGYLAGYPMVDIECVVYDGSYHPVDSNEMAFKTAGRIGFKAACENAGPVILEPIADMNIIIAEEYAGTVMSDVSSRRGRIVGTDSNDNGETIVEVHIPYAEIITYTKDLRAMTRGSGRYTYEIIDYEPVPSNIQQRLIEETQN